MTITLCGSTKFKEEFNRINLELTLKGHIVISVSAFGHADAVVWTEEQKEILDQVHKNKIEASRAIVVINKNNYIGSSTKSEIDFAKN